MAKLFHSDLEAMNSYYNNEIANLQIHNAELEKIVADLRTKLYDSIV